MIGLLFISLVSSSQELVLKLKLEEGFEIVYDLTEKEYVQKENGENGQTKVYKKQLKIIIEEVNPETNIKLRVNIVENYEETIYNYWKQRIDYIFSDLRDLKYYSVINPQSFFSSNDLIFQINLNTRKIDLLNRVELLENYHKKLSENDVEDKEKKINVFNTIYLERISKLLNFITWFHNSQITAEGRIKNSTLEDKLMLKNKSSQKFNLINDKDSLLTNGQEYKYFSINTENGLLLDYRFLKKDSIQNKYGQNVGEYLFNVTEKNYRLLSGKKINKGPVVVKGRIANPFSEKLYFRYLNEPFGVNLKKELVYLDEKGNFEVELDLKHAGFVFIENQNPNRFEPSASYVLYVDTGDTIAFHHDLESSDNPIVFTGSKIMENELLDELKRNYNIFTSGEYFDRINNAIYDQRNFVGQIQSRKTTVSKYINELWSEYESARNLVFEFENELSHQSFRYIENELKNYYYAQFFQYLSFANVLEDKNRFEAQIPKAIQQQIAFQNLNSFYNDYGFYSRKCIRQYVMYKYITVSQINNPENVFRGTFIKDLNQQIQFTRILISGAPFYRDIAAILEESFSDIIFLPWTDYNGHILDIAVAYLNLIKTNCFDKEIVEKVQAILNQYNQLQSKNSEIKKLELFDAEGKSLRLEEILAAKPTVVLFASDLMRWFLSFDRLVEEYPEISFIRVAQSSNQREWQEYNDIAKSNVPTYLYLNDSVALEDIFLKSIVFGVFNKNGELIHYTNDEKSAIKLAKQSLEQKKELNKSQLQFIVLLLSVVLISLIAGFIFWKWRVRQRFRREQQQRRLRELELTAIRSQMNPHFLFNCLNSVQNLVQQNKGREAHLYLADFAGLIRKVLQNSEKEEVSLAEELEMVQQYLNLEKLRFDFNFQITTGEGIDPHNTLVPSMLLQPFAENAVIHGLQHKEGSRFLKIEVSKEDTRLAVDNRLAHKASEHRRLAHTSSILIKIEDNGIGRVAAQKLAAGKNGKGSKLMQERLKILQEKQGEKYRLQIIDLTENGATGTRVEIWIPEEK